ncbi:MAG: hypothetical protein JO185_05500 [Acidobacteriaceae bacterium]|nr:hypothetical protein [Acidobacteriaceae bacterium]
MQVVGLRRSFAITLIPFLVLLFGALPSATADNEEIPSSLADDIINKYLQAKSQDNELRGASMEVEISAQVPKLNESGTLRALRKISRVGQITYRQIAFQGANFVKKEIIARYLDAEKQEQGDQDIGITPENYKFKYKGQVPSQANSPAFVFQLTPRKKKLGLFKGEMWIDCKTYLPVFEKGRLVKNPSVFFKKVDFRRGFNIQNGLAVPTYLVSTIDTRLVGKIEINISFSKFAQGRDTEADEDAADSAATRQSMLQ